MGSVLWDSNGKTSQRPSEDWFLEAEWYFQFIMNNNPTYTDGIWHMQNMSANALVKFDYPKLWEHYLVE